MLATTITLSVDKANNATPGNEVFAYDTHVNPNKSLYYGDLHTVDSKETLVFTRVPAKVNGEFKGTQRSSQKYSRDFSVATVSGGTMKATAVIEVASSFPVGMTTAQKMELRQYIVALLDNDTVMNLIHDNGQV